MTRLGRIALLISMLIVVAAAADAQQTVAKTMKRMHDPIQVPGELLQAFQGTANGSIRVFAAKDGKMAQIPYQIDERLDDGTFVFELGEGKNADQANNKLDPQDFLVFRIQDTGDRAPNTLWPSPEAIEIELADPLDGGLSYAYLVRFPKDPPEQLKVETFTLAHWDPWQQPELPFIVQGLSYNIEGLVNNINKKYYKTAVNKVFTVPVAAGGTGVNILDVQKMRAFVELKGGFIKVEKNETNMIGGIDALRHGAVRGFGRQWLTVALPLGIEGPRIYSDVFTYDRVIVSPMMLNIPINPDMIINRAGIEFGYDFNNAAKGMRFYSPNCLEGVTIDGVMSDREKQLPTTWVPWFLVTGPQGSLIFRVEIQKELAEQTKNNLTYIDDLGQAFPPESIPGSIGYARTTVELASVKAGQYEFQIEWYFPPHLYKEGGYDKDVLNQFLNIRDNPVVIKVAGKQAKNEALNPPMLVPKKKK